MPINKNAVLRYRIIDGCLRNKMRKYPTVEILRTAIMQATDKLSISDSQVHKDIRFMKDYYKAPIAFSREYGGYYYSESDFSVESFPLTHDEIKVLDMSTAIFKQLKYSGYFKQFESIIEKLISGYRISKIPGYENLNILEVEEPLTDTGVQWIELIYESILHKNVLKVDYKKYNSEETKTHFLSAYVIREYRNRWYVTGYSDRADAIVTLALDRVVDIQMETKKCYEQKDFNVQDYFKYGFGVTVYENAKPSLVELQCDESLTGYFLSKPLHASQKVLSKERGLLLQMECYLTPELEMTILSYGELIKVLSPTDLINRIRKRVVAMAERYS